MAEETPAEQEERLQRREERLAKQHERLKDPPPHNDGGSAPKADSVGKGVGGFFSFIVDHKIASFAVASVIVLIIIVYYINTQGAGGQYGNAANATGQAQNPGYQDVGTAEALTQLTSQLNSIEQQLANPSTTTSGSGNGIGNGPTWWDNPGSKGLLGGLGAEIKKVGDQYYFRDKGTGNAWEAIPLPPGTKISRGRDNRWWYILPGETKKRLLKINAKGGG